MRRCARQPSRTPPILFVLAFVAASWLLALIVITWGIGTLKHLRNTPPYAGPRKHVSIVIAARNEADTIAPALASLLAQEYPSFDVIVANDRSDDTTGEILERIAAVDARLKVLHIAELPADWLGKNHALQAAAQQASGEYVLFTDADVVLEATALARAVAFCERHALDHIAVFPDIPAPNYWTGAFFATFGLGFLALTQPWFARNGRTPLPVGIGAFNFVRRSAYVAIEGHTRLALRPDDDIALAYHLRANKGRQDILIGDDLVSVEWYKSLGAAVRGFEKNAIAPFEYSPLVVLCVVAWHFVTYSLPWVALFTPYWRLGLVTTVLQMLAFGATSPVVKGAWKYAPALPLGALLFEYAVLRAAYLTFRHGGIRWRDTFYSLDKLRTNRLRK